VKEIIFAVILFSIPMAFAQEYPETGVKVETVAENLTIPWSIDWLPDGTILFTERNGHLRVIQNGELLEDPLLSLGVGGVEGGMLGVAVDPDFEENNFIYLYYTYNEFLSTTNKLARFQLVDGKLTEDKILLDGIPGGPFHDGGRIQFGPDGKLYITTGEAGDPKLAQDLNSLGGKILRINSDGTIPEDNPWENSSIYSIGHRNPQGIDWDEFGNLVATEHGPSGWRGVAHDEINLIFPGTNYGWPDIIGDETADDLQNPILHTGDDTWAPSGAEFYYGDKIPQWTGKYFVATLRGSHLHMIDFDLQEKMVLSHEKLFQDGFGRLRDVQTGPDGFLYILTSNKDGRGFPNANDDKILRIIPINSINNFEDCVTFGNPIMESYPRQCRTEDGRHFVEVISEIPDWVRKTAKWWSLNQIADEEYSSGLQYLIEKNIIIVPIETLAEGSSEQQLPSWLRKDAGWWSQGSISDEEYFKSIQWMMNNNFIKTEFRLK
jgi:glucose/arabinose dehydrogenase